MVRLSILDATLKGNAAGQVSLDHPCDDVHRRALGSQNKVDASGACELGNARDAGLNICGCNHHQIGQLIDNADDIRQLFTWDLKGIIIAGDFDLLESVPLFGTHVRLHRFRLSLLRFIFQELGIKACNIAHVRLSKNLVAMLHLGDQPFEGSRHFLGLGHHGDEHVRQRVIHLHFHYLWVDHNEAKVLGPGVVKERRNNGIDTNGLTRTGGTSDQHVRHLS